MSGAAPVGRDWDARFTTWSNPPSETEDERCENASRMVREALAASPALAWHKIDVFAHGSYRNNTNVRLGSDVDVCVRCADGYYPDFSSVPGVTRQSLGLVDLTYGPVNLKADIEAALRVHFGATNVQRGNKVLVVHENTYRVSADVAPTFERRRYVSRGGQLQYYSGVTLHPDRGASIENWPQQHYDAGVAKNQRTGRRFKAAVRILKRLRDEMEDGGYYPPTGNAGPASLFIESLVWQVPDDRFGGASLGADVQGVLTFLASGLATTMFSSEWTEIGGMKYLFRGRPDWTQRDALTFVIACLRYTGMV